MSSCRKETRRLHLIKRSKLQGITGKLLIRGETQTQQKPASLVVDYLQGILSCTLVVQSFKG